MRNLEKSVKEYEKQFCGDNHGKGALYLSDLQQVINFAKDTEGDCINMLYRAADFGLKAGFMIGYRLGRKEGRNK